MLIDSQEHTLQQTSTDQMSSEFGSSASFSVSETVGGDVMEIAKAEVTSTQKTAFTEADCLYSFSSSSRDTLLVISKSRA
ncbi:hypothetical protein [Endozoicomonas numazuensis]|uniref:Uncharacterized protein n=1 Tax=Endozoicomonas numazuensis TaxID=1137799 RepID=A0A081NHK7_9GAMM|nr:hypothetical protein [Endozoicomonas numazuensis]KEQ17930.1 hypothetical protein GZ78_09920 [Endozoicomonas numazuensis]